MSHNLSKNSIYQKKNKKRFFINLNVKLYFKNYFLNNSSLND